MANEIFFSQDNFEVKNIQIAKGELSASVLSWGATLKDLFFSRYEKSLVLGFNDFVSYRDLPLYFGSTVGRYANRISNGVALLDGNEILFHRNSGDQHFLHGGSQGFSERNWRVSSYGVDFVKLEILDPHNTMGFPGNCSATCEYRIEEPNKLRIELAATCDQPTFCSLAHHSYFCLDNSGDIKAHELQIMTDKYLPTDEDVIPTGEIKNVAKTNFDFRKFRTLGDYPYDHNFCFQESPRLKKLASVRSQLSNLSVSVYSTAPGLQLYTGHNIHIPENFRGEKGFGPYSGLCLEPQIWPDSPNNCTFPSAVLRPNEIFRQSSVFEFDWL